MSRVVRTNVGRPGRPLRQPGTTIRYHHTIVFKPEEWDVLSRVFPPIGMSINQALRAAVFEKYAPQLLLPFGNEVFE